MYSSDSNDDCGSGGALNWADSINDASLAITVYDSDALYTPQERVDVQVFNNKEESLMSFTTEHLFWKSEIRVGKGDDQDCIIKDGFTSSKHCSLDFNKWFKTKRDWVQIYKTLLTLERKLPVGVCRLIASFFWEPRSVLLKDKNSLNGTLLCLKPRMPYELRENQRYILSESLEMAIGDKEQFQDYNFWKGEEANKKILPAPVFISDNLRAEEGDNSVFQVLSIHFKQRNRSKIVSTYKLASNRNSARFLVGKSCDARIHIPWASVDDYQCEIVLNNGQWYFCEWHHQKKTQRSWLSVKGEKNHEIEIKEDSEILIGRSLMKISF